MCVCVFVCVPVRVIVMTCSDYSCNSGKPMRVTLSEGYLASVVTLSSGCGSESCPWVLQALPGQHFNLTFRSFARVQSSSEHEPSQRQRSDPQQSLVGRFCQRLATVTELSSHVSKDVTLCDNDVAVVRLMTSAHDQVKLKLYYGTPENPAYFIVRYEGSKYDQNSYWRSATCPCVEGGGDQKKLPVI